MLCIFFKVFSLSCLCRILFLNAYTFCIVHWLSVGHASDLHWAYWLVCPDVHFKCEWALWSLFYSDCLFGQAMVYYLIHFFFLLDRSVLTSYALQVFLHTMIISCCCVLGDSCSYVSKATQILELGVSEFCSTIPNSHVTSRVCFRVLSENRYRGRM